MIGVLSQCLSASLSPCLCLCMCAHHYSSTSSCLAPKVFCNCLALVFDISNQMPSQSLFSFTFLSPVPHSRGIFGRSFPNLLCVCLAPLLLPITSQRLDSSAPVRTFSAKANSLSFSFSCQTFMQHRETPWHCDQLGVWFQNRHCKGCYVLAIARG